MASTKRWVVAILTALVALVAWAPPAAAVGNSDAALKAGRWVAGQPAPSDVGAAADSLLALAAVGDPALAPQAGHLLDIVRDGHGAYVASSPTGAAKLTLVAVSLGRNPRDFFGTDLVAAVKAGVKADGSFGEYPGPFASGLGLLALTRAQEPIPHGMAQFLVRSANADGGFGWGSGRPSDADSTGLAILGMLTQTDSISARDAVTRAVVWATAQQQADGSWRGEGNPVNSTAILGSALQAAGQPQPRAVQYLVSQQLPDGALPDQGQPNLLATQQAALLLADTSYAAISSPRLAAALTPGASPLAPPPATQPTAPETPAETVAPTGTPAASAEAPGPPESTPLPTDAIGASGVILLILLLLLLGGAAYLMFGRRPVDPSVPTVTGSPAADAPPATPQGPATGTTASETGDEPAADAPNPPDTDLNRDGKG